MKIELDDDIDRILRAQMARRRVDATPEDSPRDAASNQITSNNFASPADAAPAFNASLSGAHLDTDALSLYVEQALPPALRASYTRHLIFCATCREQVAMLARLVEVADETNVATQPAAIAEATESPRAEIASAVTVAPRASIWERLTQNLFAPRGLAYALPALALVLLAVTIFWITSRPEPEPDALVADGRQPAAMNANAMTANMNSSASEMSGASGQASSNANVNYSAPPTPSDTSQESEAASRSLPTTRPTPLAPENTQTTATTQNVNDATRNAAASARQPETLAAPSSNQLPNNAPDIALRSETQSPVITDTEAKARRDDAKSKTVADADEARLARAASSEAEKSSGARVGVPAAQRSTVSAATSTMPQSGAPTDDVARRERTLRRGAGAQTNDIPSATRTIGGKRFVRRGAAWVDESFVVGSTLIDVRRNSSQYLALLTTEPALRFILESLSGEVIIVAKNRAYRVR